MKNNTQNDTVLLINTGYPATGLVVSIPIHENFGGTYICTENDTIPLTADEHNELTEEYHYSNLITFKKVTDQFQFYPGDLDGTIRFSFIDARMPANTSTKKEVKKKRCRLFRARDD